MTAGRPATVGLVGPFPPPYGGMGVYFASLEAGLTRAGLTALRIPVPYAALGGWRRQLTRLLVFARAALVVLRARPDVVHCVTGSQPNLLGNVLPLVAARVVGRPSILSVAGGEFPTAVSGYRGVRRRLVRFILTRPRVVVACTPEIADALRAIGVAPWHVVTLSNALPPDLDPRADQRLPAEVEDFVTAHDPVLASTSGWFDYYGSQDLVAAVRTLRAAYPRIGLVLAVKSGGDAAFRARFLAGLGDLAGHVLVREDEAAVCGIMRRADVFVRTPHHEGDAISVREALAVGTPVVASDVGFRPAGVVRYRPADAADLADRLRDTLARDGGGDGVGPVGPVGTVGAVGAVVDAAEGDRNLEVLLGTYRSLAAARQGSRLAWYVGRAATMSPREFLWRARRVGETVTHRDGLRERSDAAVLGRRDADWDVLLQRFRAGDGRPVLLDRERAHRLADRHPRRADALLARADQIMAGRHAYFGYPAVDVGTVVDWNRDPRTDYDWPAIAAARIDHRVAGSDPKWIWELNRLQHLLVLAQAWLLTGDDRYAERAFEHLDSWLEQNPVGIGIAWRGAFEAGIRAISVAVALQGLRDSAALTPQRYRRIVRMLDAGARYCWQGRSRFSSANNHLVGELAGLATVHRFFPELAVPARSYRRAIVELEGAADRLILPDGAGAEQSASYQVFTAELCALVALWDRMSGTDPSPVLLAAVRRSARYLVTVVGSGDPDPRYGDDDDGFAVRLGPQERRTVRGHLGMVAAITGAADALCYGESSWEAAWFADALAGDLDGLGAGVTRGDTVPGGHAPHGGLVVLRPRATGRPTPRVTMDVGPLGHGSTAAHGHADALAVTLACAGRDLVVDPGTGSYYGNPAWRTVHRGTRAHPTVCVDGVDQSVIGGPFYWSRQAHVTVHAVDVERGIVDAEHDGYRRLHDPVGHRRWLIAGPTAPTVIVVDLLEGAAVHDVALSWPLHPELDWIPTPDGHLVDRDDTPALQLCHAATAPIDLRQVRADTDSGLGWWSDRLEARTPAWLLGVHARTELPLALLTLLRADDAETIGEPTIVCNGTLLHVGWTEGGVGHALTIDTTRPGAVTYAPTSTPSRLVSES